MTTDELKPLLLMAKVHQTIADDLLEVRAHCTRSKGRARIAAMRLPHSVRYRLPLFIKDHLNL
jgi:hypothetical protein